MKKEETTKAIIFVGLGIVVIIGVIAISSTLGDKSTDKKPLVISDHEKMCRERFPAHYTDEIHACIEGRMRLSAPPRTNDIDSEFNS